MNDGINTWVCDIINWRYKKMLPKDSAFFIRTVDMECVRILIETYKWVAFSLASSSRLFLIAACDTEVFQGYISLGYHICAVGVLALPPTTLFKSNFLDVHILEMHSMFENLQKDFGF